MGAKEHFGAIARAEEDIREALRPILKQRDRLKKRNSPSLAEYREFTRVCAGIVEAKMIKIYESERRLAVAMDGPVARLVETHYCKGDDGLLSFQAGRWSVPLASYHKLVEAHRAEIDVITRDDQWFSRPGESCSSWTPCLNQQLVEKSWFVAALLGPNPKLYAMPHSKAFRICVEHAFLLVNALKLPIYFGVDFTYADLLASCFPDVTLEACSDHGMECPCYSPDEATKCAASAKLASNRALLLYNLELQVPWRLETEVRLATIHCVLADLPFVNPSPAQVDILLEDAQDPQFTDDRRRVEAIARWSYYPRHPDNKNGYALLWYMETFLENGCSLEKKRILGFLADKRHPSPQELEAYILSKPPGKFVESLDAFRVLEKARL